jgi:aarF domain-containing kinase
MLELYCHEFFVIGMVQTDPNFSNFLIREREDEFKLVLLDFGATKKYEQIFIDNYIELIRSLETDDAQKIIGLSIKYGFLDSKEDTHVQKLYLEMMKLAIEPFMTCKKAGKFDFSDIDYSKRSSAILREFMMALKYSAPPHQIIFLHRKLGGLFSLLKRLNLELDIYPYWTKMTKQNKA